MSASPILPHHPEAGTTSAVQPQCLETTLQQRPLYSSFGNTYLDRQSEIESNTRSYPRRLPIAPKSARGILMYDVEGREYIDCLAGAGALALGHNHPVVTEAIFHALEAQVPLQTLDLPTPLKDRFIDELFEALPGEFAAAAKIQFCGPSGADAVEAALKLVKTATGRRSLLCFHGSYHGMTSGALSITGDVRAKAAVVGFLPEVQFLPFPSDYHCPFGIGGEAGWQASANYIESILESANSGISAPAGMIVEVVQGEGGINPAPDGWLRRIRDITRRHAVALIVDEVQTGLGRTGSLFAFQRAGIVPDVVVLSKAIGGGLPLAVIVYHRDLDLWKPGAHAGTFRGNQLAFAAGSATIHYIRANRLERHAQIVGNLLARELERIAEQSHTLGDVRGRGLMIGVEVVDPDRKGRSIGPPSGWPEMARLIQTSCLERGLIVELAGPSGNVVRFLPPLIVTSDQIGEIAARFEEAVKASEARRDTIR